MNIKEKNNNKCKAGPSVFDRMMEALAVKQEESGFLDVCMSFNYDLVRKVPLRYRVIALGFAKQSTLQEVNEMLKEQGCATLYSRSLWEASLIYAFYNGLSYEGWKELQEICKEISERKEKQGKYFRSSRISYRDIRTYVEDNSQLLGQTEMTQHLTRALTQKIMDLSPDQMEFREFLENSFELMSSVREKTRYYFCKYLYYYLSTCLERYLKARKDGRPEETALEDLAIFKGITVLKRKTLSDEKVRELLADSGVSFGAVFDAFNFFYFDYVSLDWMEVLLEYYGNFSTMSEGDRAKLVKSLRNYAPKKYAGLSDSEVLRTKQEEIDAHEYELDDIFSRDGDDKGYQKNRSGEDTIRRYVKGSLDIDRTTLICFLIFFSSNSVLPENYLVNRERLNEILAECGFAELRGEDSFDGFIIEFLKNEDPVSLLMNEVTDYALREENFYLYRMYNASRSAEEDMNRLN